MAKRQQNQQKKIKERQIIDAFRRGFTEFPKGRLVSAESPDFVLRTGPKTAIGIELMSIVLPPGPRSGILSGIENAILVKEEKLFLYRRKMLDRYWLLLYTENQVLKTDPGKLSHLNITSGYQKIFFMRFPEGIIIEIK